MEKNPGQNGPDGAAAGERREEREKEEPRVPAEGPVPQEVFYERMAMVFGRALRPERPAPTTEAIEATERFKELVCELAFPRLPAPGPAKAPAAPEAPAGRAKQAPPPEKPVEEPPRVGQTA
jgi:hypothetical protein